MSGEIVLGLRLLLSAALYAFIGWAFFIMWKDLRQQGALVSTRHIPPVHLAWILDGQEVTHRFAAPSILIGRDPICECPLPNETVSARHARLVFHHKQWWLEDLNSRNGTYLNDEPLYTTTVIESGDDIRCGQVCLTVRIGEKA